MLSLRTLFGKSCGPVQEFALWNTCTAPYATLPVTLEMRERKDQVDDCNRSCISWEACSRTPCLLISAHLPLPGRLSILLPMLNDAPLRIHSAAMLTILRFCLTLRYFLLPIRRGTRCSGSPGCAAGKSCSFSGGSPLVPHNNSKKDEAFIH